MRFILICFLLTGFVGQCYAQADSTRRRTAAVRNTQANVSLLDSVASASLLRQQFVGDSLAMLFVKKQDPARHNQFFDDLMKNYVYRGYGFWDMPQASKQNLGTGQLRKARDNWVIAVVMFTLLYAGFLRLTITKDINNIIQAFYNKQLFSQGDNEATLLSFRAFLGLLLLLGLTFGLFIYQLSGYYHIYYQVGGFALFFTLSATVILLLGLKLLLLKFLGFVFNIGPVVDKYIVVLCFTYFTITFIFLPVVTCLSLLTAQLVPLVLLIALLLTGAILVWLYLRNSIIIISNFRFSKFYLFVYLCALEICPIFILIKAINI